MERNAKNTECIPFGIYCHDKNGICPYWKELGTRYLHREEGTMINGVPASPCSHTDTCKNKCWTTPRTQCSYTVVKCEFLDVTDDREETLLWDKVKACDVNED